MERIKRTYKRITYHNGKPHVEKAEKGIHTIKAGSRIAPAFQSVSACPVGDILDDVGAGRRVNEVASL